VHPAEWDAFKVHYRYRETTYHITVCKRATKAGERDVDGVEQSGKNIPLVTTVGTLGRGEN